MTETKKLDWNVFKNRFHESYHLKLQPFFETEECYNILAKLTEEAKAGKNVLPGKGLMWRCLQETSLDDLKVVFLGLSPYPQEGIGDGLAFSNSLSFKESPSLRIILDSVEDDLGYKDNRNKDLKRWANQGVLLLNSALTCNSGEPKSHLDLWKPFTSFLFKEVFNDKELVIVYFGADAKEFKSLENNKLHSSKTVEHPAFAAREERPLRHQNLWSWCNTMLKSKNKSEIGWLEGEKKVILEEVKEWEDFI